MWARRLDPEWDSRCAPQTCGQQQRTMAVRIESRGGGDDDSGRTHRVVTSESTLRADDAVTGSFQGWNKAGEAIRGTYAGRRLKQGIDRFRSAPGRV
ncbi:MAG TPA: hypothetical protein PLN93_08875 [Vicinamibacterales bacterium]|nr:hypothetical protein [Vicinamibacterales bacterium]HPK72038.1 hypothetical protein [Vicinamibacterales bacterium]